MAITTEDIALGICDVTFDGIDLGSTKGGVEVTVKTTNYFPLPFLMRAALTVFGLPERLVPERTAPLLGLKLGNIGTIARKPK